MIRRVAVSLSLCLVLAYGAPARADDAVQTYTIEQAVADAVAAHPRVRAAQEETSAADARVDEAHASELPALGVSAQVNRSTGNTVPGAFFPQTGFVPIAGPTRGKTFDGGAWQSGASLWATWDVLAFSRQAATIDLAIAGRSEASAVVAAQRLDVAYRAADSFLALLEAQEAVRLAQINVQRAEVLATVTKTLADQNLRPGADASRAEAELASARTLLARAEQAREVRRSELATAIGRTELRVEADAGALAAPIDDVAARASAPPASHPDIVRAEAAVTRAEQAEHVVATQYLPRIDLVASVWMRGSGLFDSPAAGLVPDVPNWAAGGTITWSILDIPTIRARARAASATHDAATARRDESVLAVAGQLRSASAVLDGAQRVSKQTAPTLAAARTAQEQAVARFKTGLTSVVDVADAQRVLAQAELDDVVARLEVRRALLLLARASGDLSPFLARAKGGR